MRLTQIIEALLFASDAPLTAADLARIDERLDEDTVTAVIDELRSDYDMSERSFQVYEVAGGYQILTRPEFVSVLERYDTVPQTTRLSTPALEVLAIIAYRQPLGRAEVEEIRGVQSAAVLRTLQDRGLIEPVGRAEALGRPLLYGTTAKFLEHFGFRSLEDLPRPDELPVVLRTRQVVEPPAAEEPASNEPPAEEPVAGEEQVTAGTPAAAGALPATEEPVTSESSTVAAEEHATATESATAQEPAAVGEPVSAEQPATAQDRAAGSGGSLVEAVAGIADSAETTEPASGPAEPGTLTGVAEQAETGGEPELVRTAAAAEEVVDEAEPADANGESANPVTEAPDGGHAQAAEGADGIAGGEGAEEGGEGTDRGEEEVAGAAEAEPAAAREG